MEKQNNSEGGQSTIERSDEEILLIRSWEYNQSNSSTFVAPPNIKFAISVSNLVALSERAFCSHELLTQVHLKEGIQTIGDQAFHGCGLLVEIDIPSTVQTVGRAAFAQCASLKRAVFCQSSLPCELGPQVFANCPSLEDLHLLRDGDCKMTIPNEFCMDCIALKQVIMPALLKSIGEGAFASCRSMRNVSLPSTLEEIGSKAFFQCKQLRTVSFSKLPTTTVESSVELVVGKSAFEKCYYLTNLSLPSTIHTLGERALAGCYYLAVLNHLPEQLQVLGPGVLEEAIKLESIRIPKQVSSIPCRAFFACKRLAVVEFAADDGKLERIESEAFACCPKLSSVSVPSFVRRIDRHAFSKCRQLVSVELSDATAVDPSAFSSCHHLVNLKMSSRHILPFQDSCTFEEDAWLPDGLMDCKLIQHVYHGDGDNTNPMDENTTTSRNKEMSVKMLKKLRNRWSRLPIHRLCYYQIHYPPEETVRAMQQSQQLIRNGTNTTYEFQPFDEFGISPFHILAMSTNPRYQVFAQLMRFYSVNVLFTKSPWGMRPALCAFRNVHLDYSTVVRQYIRAIVSVRVPQLRWKGWRLTIYQLLEVFCPEDRSRRPRHLVRLQRKLAMFEHLESLALLEHAVWKNRLMDLINSPTPGEPSTGGESSPGGQRKRIKTDSQRNSKEDFRLACRTISGASVVISRVLPFLEDWSFSGY